jgi:hypothetical protein
MLFKKMGALSYNLDCSISKYITPDDTKVQIYGNIDYKDFIGNYNISNNNISDRKIFSIKIPSNLQVKIYNNNNLEQNAILTGNGASYVWQNMTKFDVLAYTIIVPDPTKVQIYGNINYKDFIGNYNISNNNISSRKIFSIKIP